MYLFSNRADRIFNILLRFEEDEIHALVWRISQENQIIVPNIKVNLKVNKNDKDNLHDQVTKCISVLSKSIHEKGMIKNRVLFCFPENWIVDGDIKPKHRTILKYVNHKLDLKVLGFITVCQAIANRLCNQQLAPLDVIIIIIELSVVEITIIKQNQIFSSIRINRTRTLNSCLIQAFTKIETQVLPNLLIFSGMQINQPRLQEEIYNLNLTKIKDKFTTSPHIKIYQLENCLNAIFEPLFQSKPTLLFDSELVDLTTTEINKENIHIEKISMKGNLSGNYFLFTDVEKIHEVENTHTDYWTLVILWLSYKSERFRTTVLIILLIFTITLTLLLLCYTYFWGFSLIKGWVAHLYRWRSILTIFGNVVLIVLSFLPLVYFEELSREILKISIEKAKNKS